MTFRPNLSKLDAEGRARLRELDAQINAILDPIREDRKIKDAKGKRNRKAALGRTDGQRAPQLEDPKYLSWIRGLPCVGCVQDKTPSRSMRCEAAHVRFGDARAGWAPTGMGQKPDDRRTLPLCCGHHREGPKAQHGARERAWWEARDICPPALCAALSAAYEAGEDGAAVIRAFVAQAQPKPRTP
jgi:hypothetical protein